MSVRRVAILATILALACGLCAAEAWADGDPASDVLTTQSLFLPQDAGISPGEQSRLVQLLEEATHSGYPLRVAVVASASDLGSVTELWRQPQTYSRFLGQELSLVYRGPLLVVMPDGYGVYGVKGGQGLEGTAGAPGSDLGPATVGMIRRLAGGAGHSLPLPSARSEARAGSSDLAAWLVFAVGAVLIAAAWVASLRARPPVLPRMRSAS